MIGVKPSEDWLVGELGLRVAGTGLERSEKVPRRA